MKNEIPVNKECTQEFNNPLIDSIKSPYKPKIKI